MRRGWTWVIVLVIAALIAGIGTYGAHLIAYGLSVRDKPSSVETAAVRRLRHWAIPARATSLKNPMPATAEMLVQGRNHWADHCAACHANNGKGGTEIGRNLYPRAPDMRQPETQSLSDGDLYYIVRNGIRMTGMPAWGKPEDGDFDHETWMLVLFIRHLPQLSVEDREGNGEIQPEECSRT